MALPKLNDKPKYEMVIPSTGKKVNYRPYLVREEKVLMMALESGDKRTALEAVIDTIQSCIHEEVDKNSLTSFDIEYMFIMIRSKSVGEISEVGIKCSDCGQVNDVPIQLDNIEVVNLDVDRFIDLGNNISLKMKYPNFKDISALESLDLKETEKVFRLIGKCIESVETEEEHILIRDVPESEVEEFIESLSNKQFSKIKNFIENLPGVKKDVKFICGGCQKENHLVLQGIDDFF